MAAWPVGNVLLWQKASHAASEGLWSWEWEWRADVSAVLLILGALYVLGWLRLRRRGYHRLAGWRGLVAYLAGLLVIAVALMSPIDPMGEQFFFMHMVQHELLIYLAPPLLLVGRALPFSLWGMPRFLRRELSRLLVQESVLRRGLRFLTRPVVAFVLSTAILWLWHHPLAYNLALENDTVHDLEHLSFFLAFLLYWWPLIGSPPQRPQLTTDGARGLYLVAGGMQSALLGGLITFTNHVVYTYYLTVSRPGGLSLLADQQLGGVVMWFPGPLIFGLAAAFTMGKG